MVVPLVILVALVKRKIGQGYSNSGRFSGRPSMSPFLAICFILVIDTRTKKLTNKLIEICFEGVQTVGKTIFLYL